MRVKGSHEVPQPTAAHTLLHAWLRAEGALRRKPRVVIAAGPHPITPFCLPWKVGQLLNVEFAEPSVATGAELGLWFEMAVDPPVRKTASDYFGGLPALNAGCPDTSKRLVARTFADVAGYGYEVDPLTHTGPMVRKADGNGKHDGKILEGPIDADEVDEGSVYQRLIDSTRAGPGDLLEDYRITIIGREIAYVLVKVRPREMLFDHTRTFREGDAETLTEEERALVLGFTEAFRVDLAEMDIARDAGDGRLYVLDVNTTPVTPVALPQRLARRQALAAAAAFERQFLTPPEGAPR